jgi:hypothetical protein
MATNQADVLALVKSRLLLQNNNLDALIDSYIQELEQRILNYCNVEAVPDGLSFVWASMVVDLVKIKHAALPEIEAALGVTVETKIGDTTTKITTNKTSTDAIVLSYSADLNRYRKLGW